MGTDQQQSLGTGQLAHVGATRHCEQATEFDGGRIGLEEKQLAARPRDSLHLSQQFYGVVSPRESEDRNHAVESPVWEWQPPAVPRLELELPGHLAQPLRDLDVLGAGVHAAGVGPGRPAPGFLHDPPVAALDEQEPVPGLESDLVEHTQAGGAPPTAKLPRRGNGQVM